MNPDRIQIAVFDGLPIDPHLMDWLKMFRHVEMVSRFKGKDAAPHLAMWRNRVCKWFLEKTELDALLFLEHSKLPMPSTFGVIASDWDVCGCVYTYDDATHCHPEDGLLGTGCLRMSRLALEAMEKPWFDYILTPDGCNVDLCSCGWFCKRATEAGFPPKTVGRIGRTGTAVFWPSDEGKTRMQRYEDFRTDNRSPK